MRPAGAKCMIILSMTLHSFSSLQGGPGTRGRLHADLQDLKALPGAREAGMKPAQVS